jgi:hypothetical protein
MSHLKKLEKVQLVGFDNDQRVFTTHLHTSCIESISTLRISEQTKEYVIRTKSGMTYMTRDAETIKLLDMVIQCDFQW